jgi:uncharacterized alkaline shock family protein YloU
MRLLTVLTITLYTVLLVAIGILLISLSFQLISPLDVSGTLDVIQQSKNVRIFLGIVGGLLILISIGIVQFIMSKMQREKTIAFNNPDGQVTISLTAIEDFIKKVSRQIPDIKDIKSDVIASKKGVNITTRVTLWSDTNIPDVTERIQGMIKTRLQEMLGLEESILVSVNVSKIVQKEESSSKKEETEVPYSGIQYR